ncbi:XRE family transcriptional regulator [Methylobacterium soli]|nr:XRE family transcriptional regulator [Methylobacterium soli]
MSTLLGDALRDAREKLKLSKAQLGRDLKISGAAISQWEAGETVPTTHNLLRVAKALRINLNEAPFSQHLHDATSFDEAAGASVRHGEQSEAASSNVREDREAPPFATIQGFSRDVPILGTAVGGDDADFHMNGKESDRAIRPPGLAMVRDLFALRVTNDSMYPAWKDGALFYVNPHRNPVIGDDVVIELHPTEPGEPGKAFMKRLKSRSPSKYVVEQFNPPKEIEFKREDVRHVYRVTPWEEALGFT